MKRIIFGFGVKDLKWMKTTGSRSPLRGFPGLFGSNFQTFWRSLIVEFNPKIEAFSLFVE